jgi:hypothetical protein
MHFLDDSLLGAVDDCSAGPLAVSLFPISPGTMATEGSAR